MLAIASVGLIFQANIYGQEGSQPLSRAVFLADLEPRAASNATGIAVFEILGGDTMSYTINATGTSNIGNIWLSQSTGGRFTDLVQFHSATRDGLINAPINGTVASGNFTAADFFGAPLRGKSMSDLAKMIVDGQVFVRIGTSNFPSGEIIGKLTVI
ncbi:MAG: CHRD domain-containing protein [Nitrososphaeraceae archaeon]